MGIGPCTRGSISTIYNFLQYSCDGWMTQFSSSDSSAYSSLNEQARISHPHDGLYKQASTDTLRIMHIDVKRRAAWSPWSCEHPYESLYLGLGSKYIGTMITTEDSKHDLVVGEYVLSVCTSRMVNQLKTALQTNITSGQVCINQYRKYTHVHLTGSESVTWPFGMYIETRKKSSLTLPKLLISFLAL